MASRYFSDGSRSFRTEWSTSELLEVVANSSLNSINDYIGTVHERDLSKIMNQLKLKMSFDSLQKVASYYVTL